MSSKTRSEQAVADTRWRASREAVLDRRFSRDRVDHGPNETSPLERSQSKGDSLGPGHIIELAAFRFSNHLRVTPTSSLACSLGASERRQFLLIRKYSQDRDANPVNSRRSKSLRPKLKVAGPFVVPNVAELVVPNETELVWPVAALAL